MHSYILEMLSSNRNRHMFKTIFIYIFQVMEEAGVTLLIQLKPYVLVLTLIFYLVVLVCLEAEENILLK